MVLLTVFGKSLPKGDFKLKRKLLVIFLTFIVVILSFVVTVSLVKFNISVESSGSGTVVLPKNQVHLFECVTVYFATDTDYPRSEIEYIFVNGEDCTEKMHNNRLKLNFITKDIILTVSFVEDKTYVPASSSAVFV